MNHLLLIEDDTSLIDGLCYSLKKNGFMVDTAQTAARAYECLETEEYDLILLDITLPDGNGLDVCRWVRARGSLVPVIFLTALDEEVNIIRGLDEGGDDYITKPFRLGELCSRIRALLRRAGKPGSEAAAVLKSGGLSIDLLGSRASLGGRSLELTGAEYRLLCLLVQNTGRIVTRERILEELWDQGGSFVDDNTVSVYVRRLREKIEKDPSNPLHLLTVRGFGYQWKEGER